MFDLKGENWSLRTNNRHQTHLSRPPLHHPLRLANPVGYLSPFARNPPLVPNVLLLPMLAFVLWTNMINTNISYLNECALTDIVWMWDHRISSRLWFCWVVTWKFETINQKYRILTVICLNLSVLDRWSWLARTVHMLDVELEVFDRC